MSEPRNWPWGAETGEASYPPATEPDLPVAEEPQLPEVSSYAFSDEGWSHQNPWAGEEANGDLTSPESETETRRVRRARLRLSRIDPWSVMKMSFLFSALGGIILWVSVSVLWGVIEASGVFESVNQAASSLFSGPGQEEFRIQKYLSANKVLGMTAVLAALDVVIITAVSTLGAFMYNLSTLVMGGIEMTWTED